MQYGISLCLCVLLAMYMYENINTTTGITHMHVEEETYTVLTSDKMVHILGIYEHDAKAFTQGLFVESSNILIESTGLYGQSQVRRVEVKSGKIVDSIELDASLFGEGITKYKDQYIVLTWTSRRGFILRASDLHIEQEFEFTTSQNQGWGIATDNDKDQLIVSDGTNILHFWEPSTLKETHRVAVHLNNQPVHYLNELEYANGFLYANVWYQKAILKINPSTGQVVQIYDCTDLYQMTHADHDQGAVLNGIAYDPQHNVFFITGKLWDKMFRVRLM